MTHSLEVTTNGFTNPLDQNKSSDSIEDFVRQHVLAHPNDFPRGTSSIGVEDEAYTKLREEMQKWYVNARTNPIPETKKMWDILLPVVAKALHRE